MKASLEVFVSQRILSPLKAFWVLYLLVVQPWWKPRGECYRMFHVTRAEVHFRLDNRPHPEKSFGLIKFTSPINFACLLQWNVTPLIGNCGGRVGICGFLQSPPIPRMLLSLFICRDFLSFCTFNHVQAQGLKKIVWALSFCQLKGGCGSTTTLSLRKFPLWKIMESPW